MNDVVWINAHSTRHAPVYHDRQACGTGLSGAARRIPTLRAAAIEADVRACSFCTDEGARVARFCSSKVAA